MCSCRTLHWLITVTITVWVVLTSAPFSRQACWKAFWCAHRLVILTPHILHYITVAGRRENQRGSPDET